MTALLEVRGVSHRYGDRAVLDGVDLEVSSGEVVGLLGPNGSGKSTLLALLGGLLPRTSGEVRFAGRPLASADREFRAELGFVFQSPSLDGRLTARENLHLASRLRGLGDGGGAGGPVESALRHADLEGRADEPVDRFSGGMKRRLDLARALLHGPRLLLLDEPTTGLDEASFQRTWDRLSGLRRDGRAAILLTTHRPEEAERCDRLVVLAKGKVVATETPEALKDRVRGDLVVLRGRDPEALATLVTERVGLPAHAAGKDVHVHCEKGHEVIVRIVEALEKGRLEAISLRRPGLADAFLDLTGERLEASR